MKPTKLKPSSAILLAMLSGAVLLGLSTVTRAEYPDRPIGVMVAYNPGAQPIFRRASPPWHPPRKKTGDLYR